jgi:spermidine synthase
MSARFAELDRRATPMGEISLRRRLEPSVEIDVYEVKLGEEFLMSSLFTVAETALATLSLARCAGDELDVVVGGLGLGYTARAALFDERVRSLEVIEALPEVISWHEQHLVPLGQTLTDDPRCRLVAADFFRVIAATPAARWDAVLLDIDHAPDRVLHPSHAAFYETDGLRAVAASLRLGGVFGLWSDDLPDDEFVARVRSAFGNCETHVIAFPNFYTDEESTNTVYVATT